MQEPCTFSFVAASHDEACSSSVSLFPGLWPGLALAFFSSGSGSDDGTGLDWALLFSLVFQLFFFWTVVRHGIGRLSHRRMNEILGDWAWGWVRSWNGNWSLGRSSITRPWKFQVGSKASLFRRLLG